MGASESKLERHERLVKELLPPETAEFFVDYLGEAIHNIIVDVVAQAVGFGAENIPIPFLGSVLGHLISRYKIDDDNMVKIERQTNDKINFALIKSCQIDLNNTLEGLKNLWDQFNALKNNSPQKTQLFSAMIAQLVRDEPKFKSKNMLFFHLESFVAFATLFLIAHRIQMNNYQEIYLSKDPNAQTNRKFFYDKITDYIKFFQFHASRFIYKKFSTIHAKYEGIKYPGISVAYTTFKGTELFGKCDRNELVELIIGHYHPKVKVLVDSFDKMTNTVGGRNWNASFGSPQDFNFTKSISVPHLEKRVKILDELIKSRAEDWLRDVNDRSELTLDYHLEEAQYELFNE